MNINIMNRFLSEENIKKHLEYLRTLRLKYSVLLKSVPSLDGASMIEVARLSVERKVREEALELLWNIKSHELFFNSFADKQIWERKDMSKERLLYDVLTLSYDRSHGFIYLYNDKKGNIKISHTECYDGAFVTYEPLLCIDICEHAYFNDYGFKKDRYVSGALSYLNTGKLS